jgi:hypothetical protein
VLSKIGTGANVMAPQFDPTPVLLLTSLRVQVTTTSKIPYPDL